MASNRYLCVYHASIPSWLQWEKKSHKPSQADYIFSEIPSFSLSLILVYFVAFLSVTSFFSFAFFGSLS